MFCIFLIDSFFNNSISGENHGIWCYRAENFDLVIQNNLIAGVGRGSNGIHLGDLSDQQNNLSIIIENNTISYREFGIKEDNVNQNVRIKINNNTIRDNKYGIHGSWKFRENSIGFVSNNNIYNNTIFNVKNTINKIEGNLDFKNNWWGTIKSNEMMK